jgi:excisionase family DNA binding protein
MTPQLPEKDEEEGKENPIPITFYTVEQIAEALHIHRQRVVDEINNGNLAAYKPGKGYLIKAEDFEAWLETFKVQPKQQRTE